MKKWLKILKSPLFQIHNNYFRIFKCYQKSKVIREGKMKRKLEKKTNIRQSARIKGKKRKIELEKQKELEGIEEELHELIKTKTD